MLIVHDPAYAGWIFDPGHPTQGRRFVNGFNELRTLHPESTVIGPIPLAREHIEAVHDPEYVAEVLDRHRSSEWEGERPDMARLAQMFVGGTLTAVAAALVDRDGDGVYVHLPGAKHHANYDHASGFCVFNDWAVAIATAPVLNPEFMSKRYFILDIDAHHGDGTEDMLRDNPNVLTASIHDATIFPGTGHVSDIDHQVLNYPLPRGSGDIEFRDAAKHALEEAREFEPDIVFITAGADGHWDDPLSTLEYTLEGYRQVATAIALAFPLDTPIVIGGAGGYNPDTFTPRVWAEFTDALVTKRRRLRLTTLNDDAW